MATHRSAAAAETSTSKTVAAKRAQVPAGYDADLAKAAFLELGPAYAAIDPAEIAHVAADPELMAITAIGVAGRLAKDSLQEELTALPRDHFDPTAIERLPKAAWGLRYAVLETAKARARKSGATVPPDLIQRANEIELRMQRCCEYHLSDEVTAIAELDRLRPGTGHRDLANDLLGYAALYESFEPILSKDPKHYRASDRPDAIAVSNQIIDALGAALGPDDGARPGEAMARAITYLLNTYEEVASAGRWIRRKSPDVDQLFPSLVAAGRAAARRANAVDKEAPEATPAASATTAQAMPAVATPADVKPAVG